MFDLGRQPISYYKLYTVQYETSDPAVQHCNLIRNSGEIQIYSNFSPRQRRNIQET